MSSSFLSAALGSPRILLHSSFESTPSLLVSNCFNWPSAKRTILASSGAALKLDEEPAEEPDDEPDEPPPFDAPDEATATAVRRRPPFSSVATPKPGTGGRSTVSPNPGTSDSVLAVAGLLSGCEGGAAPPPPSSLPPPPRPPRPPR